MDSASIPYTEPANSMPEVLCGSPISGASLWEQGCPFFQFPPPCTELHFVWDNICKKNKNEFTFKTVNTETDWGKPECYQGPRNNNAVSGYCRITQCIVSGTHNIAETCRTIILKMNFEFNLLVGAAGNVSFTSCFKVLSWFCVERIECLISLQWGGNSSEVLALRFIRKPVCLQTIFSIFLWLKIFQWLWLCP